MSFSENGTSHEYGGSTRDATQSPRSIGEGTSPHAGGTGGGAPAASSGTPSVPRVRRRNRMITSCLECRRRKLKCDKQHPCTNCVKTKRDCVFLAPALDSASQLKLTEIKEKMGSLERVLEQEVGRNGAWREARRERIAATSPDEVEVQVLDDERDLEPTPLSVADAVYDKGDDDAEDDIADLGFAMGKMRLTDRIGGFLRPKFKEEMDITLSVMPGGESYKKEDLTAQLPGQPAPFGGYKDLQYLNPGPTYLPPASTMYFGGASRTQSLIDFLPAESAANYLIDQYKRAVHPICKIVHWGTFQKRYESFWSELRAGIEPVGSLQALIFAAMFCGVVSMSEEDALRHFAAAKKELVDNFQQGAETALGRAQFLRTTKLETMQAFVMYLIPLCRDQLSRAHSALVGTAIRLAECMGLHRDGSAYGMNLVEINVRRMVWYQLCMLDIRTCEAHGPRPGIREGDFDTRFPLNVDDADLEKANPPQQGASQWTDMTCTLIRMECNEMIRTIWTDRPRVEKKIISLTSLIGRIENFRRAMQNKYFPLMDSDNPLHQAARLMLIILTTRMHIMVLHRYHNSVSTKIPDRLRQIIRMTGLESVEAAMAYETRPSLEPYRWFAGALQQYQVAFLLLAEIYAHPNSPESDRIWRVLDYVYEPPTHLSARHKAIVIFLELRDRMDVYYTSRKLRAPIGVMKRLAEAEQGARELLYVGPGGYSKRRDSEGLGSPTTSPPPSGSANSKTSASPPAGYKPITLSTLHAYTDPEGRAHVDAIMGAVGLGQNPMRPNIDWGAAMAPPPAGAMAYDPSASLGTTSAMPSVGGGPWQDYGQAAAPNANLSPPNFAAGGPPTTVSDDVMADIDWTEWDKFFPPQDVSGADVSNSMAPVSSTTQLWYG